VLLSDFATSMSSSYLDQPLGERIKQFTRINNTLNRQPVRVFQLYPVSGCLREDFALRNRHIRGSVWKLQTIVKQKVRKKQSERLCLYWLVQKLLRSFTRVHLSQKRNKLSHYDRLWRREKDKCLEKTDGHEGHRIASQARFRRVVEASLGEEPLHDEYERSQGRHFCQVVVDKLDSLDAICVVDPDVDVQ
jgi:hypothetical protein